MLSSMNSLVDCCDFLSNQRVFEMPQAICEEDYLSNLPDDCLFTIFENFNHDNLDILSCVNQKISIFALTARPKTKLIEANELCVLQKENGDVEVHLIQEFGPSLFMSVKKEATSLEDANFDKSDWHDDKSAHYGPTIKRTVPCFVFDRIRYLCHRFAFATLQLFNVYVDIQFLNHCIRAFDCVPQTIEIAGIHFNEIYEFTEHKSLFLQFICSMHPRRLKLSDELLKFIASDALFLKMIRTANCIKIFRYDNEEPYVKGHRHLISNLCYDEIVKFAYFEAECCIIDTEDLMDIVLKRLNLQVDGYISVGTTAAVDRNFLLTAIEGRGYACSRLENSWDEFVCEIKTANLKWRAEFFEYDEDGYEVTIYFS